MLVDIVCGAFAAWAAFTGYRNGAFVQVLQAAMLVGTWFVGRAGAAPVGAFLERTTDLPTPLTGMVAFGLVWMGSYILLRLLLAGLFDSWRKSRPEAGGLDRLLGFALGVAKAAALIFVVLAGMDVAVPDAGAAGGALGAQRTGSRAWSTVTAHNPLREAADPLATSARDLLQALGTADGRQQVLDDPAVQRLLDELAARERAAGEAPGGASGQGDGLLDKLLDDPRVRGLLDARRTAGEGAPSPTPPAGAPPPAATPGEQGEPAKPPSPKNDFGTGWD